MAVRPTNGPNRNRGPILPAWSRPRRAAADVKSAWSYTFTSHVFMVYTETKLLLPSTGGKMRVIIIQTRHSSSVANSNVHGEPENENKNDATENRWLGVRWYLYTQHWAGRAGSLGVWSASRLQIQAGCTLS